MLDQEKQHQNIKMDSQHQEERPVAIKVQDNRTSVYNIVVNIVDQVTEQKERTPAQTASQM